MTLLYIVLSTLFIVLLSAGGIFLFTLSKDRLEKSLLLLVALSAGAMFGNAMFHLLPESLEMVEAGSIKLMTVLLIITAAFILSFLFEQLFAWHHCHNTDHCEVRKGYGHLMLVSDGIHNFIDGVLIATAFIVSPTLGIITAFTIALHEIPQEIGDYAVLVHAGWKKKKALIVNIQAAFTVVLGGVAGYFLTTSIESTVQYLLPFAAGSFIYIATSDLIPELKHETNIKKIATNTVVFILAVGMLIASTYLGA
jgi:zinc and cadmium transporter